MKYFIFSYTWKTPQMSQPSTGTGVAKFPGIIELYEDIIQQPEEYCLTHVSEITKEEFLKADANGIIG